MELIPLLSFFSETEPASPKREKQPKKRKAAIPAALNIVFLFITVLIYPRRRRRRDMRADSVIRRAISPPNRTRRSIVMPGRRVLPLSRKNAVGLRKNADFLSDRGGRNVALRRKFRHGKNREKTTFSQKKNPRRSTEAKRADYLISRDRRQASATTSPVTDRFFRRFSRPAAGIL